MLYLALKFKFIKILLNNSKINNKIEFFNNSNNNSSLENKHFPVSTKQWFNSVYLFYKNNEKIIPSIDIVVYKIITNYFNMFSHHMEKTIKLLRKSVLKRRLGLNKIFIGIPEFKHTNDRVVITLYVYNSELSVLINKINKIKREVFAEYFKKIFMYSNISKKKFKMAKVFSNKIFKYRKFIDRYINNKRYILKKLLRIKYIIMSNSKLYNANLLRIKLLKKTKNINKLSLYRKLVSKNRNIKKNLYNNIRKFRYFRNKNIKYINSNKNKILLLKYYNKSQYFKFLSSFMKKKRLIHIGRWINLFERQINLLNKSNLNKRYKIVSTSLIIIRYLSIFISKFNNKSFNFIKYSNIVNFKYSNLTVLNVLKKITYKIRLYLKYSRMINFNKYKFNLFIKPLVVFLETIYKKGVQLNIVSLKNYYLDSNILTQMISLKLKNKKNKFNNINKFLNKIKLPMNKVLEYSKEISRKRNIQNLLLSNFINKNYMEAKLVNLTNLYKNKTNVNVISLYNTLSNKDKLDLIIKSKYSSQYNLLKSNIKPMHIVNRNIENIILDSIVHKTITGIKIEGAGRLSKRATAARSVFNVIQKGTIKDINSSYKGMSSIILKGNLRSNTQFTKINGKTRIGSFGLKGWVSSL